MTNKNSSWLVRLGMPVLALCLVFAAGPVFAKGSAKDGVDVKNPQLVEGYRGITVILPREKLAFIKKGQRVDVMVTFEAQMKDVKEKVTATVLQNVTVVAVALPKKGEKGSVLLLVNPNESQYAGLSMEQGVVDLLVRKAGDYEMHPMEMASFRKLFK